MSLNARERLALEAYHRRAGLNTPLTIGQLATLPLHQLLRLEGCGKKTAQGIQEAIVAWLAID